jgi:hypothetical protein
MAYIVGFLTEEEEQSLKARGWKMEPSPRDLVPSDPPENPTRFRMVWVDASMFEIMNGPDWEKGSANDNRGKEVKDADRHRD